MDSLFEYGLTPRSISAIAIGIITLSLAQWSAHRWRSRRDDTPVGMGYVKNLLLASAGGALVGLALGSFPVGLCLGFGVGVLAIGPPGRGAD